VVRYSLGLFDHFIEHVADIGTSVRNVIHNSLPTSCGFGIKKSKTNMSNTSVVMGSCGKQAQDVSLSDGIDPRSGHGYL
jgi:hypothetical protein